MTDAVDTSACICIDVMLDSTNFQRSRVLRLGVRFLGRPLNNVLAHEPGQAPSPPRKCTDIGVWSSWSDETHHYLEEQLAH